MSTSIPLPGLDRLIAVCQRHSLPLTLSPPPSSAPKPGEFVLGEPIDPQLAAIFERVGVSEFGSLSLYSPGSDRMDLISWNERLREPDTVHYRSSLVFGEETGFPLYYGTVAKLAGAQGIQPVVYIDGYTAQYAVPIASSVDRFFDVFSRYLELVAVDPEYIHHGVTMVNFPWAMAQIIAKDEPLMEQVRAGRFDFLTNNERDATEWLQELLAAQP